MLANRSPIADGSPLRTIPDHDGRGRRADSARLALQTHAFSIELAQVGVCSRIGAHRFGGRLAAKAGKIQLVGSPHDGIDRR